MDKSNHGINISGKIEPGFERVRKEFENNFIIRGEVGAAFAVYQQGKKIIDLWGGLRDQKQKLHWELDTVARDTEQVIESTENTHWGSIQIWLRELSTGLMLRQ
jgi:hypothetical protein